MTHRCSSSHQGNMMGQCTCGLFHSQSNSFTMLFSMPNHHHHNKSFDETDMNPFASSSSSVDCTLSLGTPSTRLSEDVIVDDKRIRHEPRPSSCMSNFCWDILQANNNKTTPYLTSQSHKTISRGTSTSNNTSNNDPLLARRCANCDTTSTPLWRNGPRGPKSLCNACGIRFKKEERRANANSNNNNNNSNACASSSSSSGTMDHHYANYHNNSWVQTQKMPCFSPANEFRFIEESDRDSDSTIPFLSWRLNVTDRPSLVHDFTR